MYSGQAVLQSQTEAEELRREIERLRPEEHSCDEMVSSSHDSARMVSSFRCLGCRLISKSHVAMGGLGGHRRCVV